MRRALLVLVLFLLIGVGVGANHIRETDPELFISLGNFLFKEGLTGHAIAAYNKALEFSPDNAHALNNLGVNYLEIDTEKAQEYFIRAHEADPEYELAIKNLAVLYHQQEDYINAVEYFSKLVSMKPDDINYLYDLAINQAKKFYHVTKSLEDLENALENFYKVIEIDPGFEHAQDNIKVLEEIKSLV